MDGCMDELIADGKGAGMGAAARASARASVRASMVGGSFTAFKGEVKRTALFVYALYPN